LAISNRDATRIGGSSDHPSPSAMRNCGERLRSFCRRPRRHRRIPNRDHTSRDANDGRSSLDGTSRDVSNRRRDANRRGELA